MLQATLKTLERLVHFACIQQRIPAPDFGYKVPWDFDQLAEANRFLSKPFGAFQIALGEQYWRAEQLAAPDSPQVTGALSRRKRRAKHALRLVGTSSKNRGGNADICRFHFQPGIPPVSSRLDRLKPGVPRTLQIENMKTNVRLHIPCHRLEHVAR